MMRESADDLHGIGISISRRIITNLHCTDDTALIATSAADLHRLLNRVHVVSRDLGSGYKR